MRNIFALIQRYYVFLLFLGLQIIALIILFQNNNYHRSHFVEHSSDWVGSIYDGRDQLSRYLRLGDINDQVSLENAYLRSLLPENFVLIDTTKGEYNDSLYFQRYTFRSAKVVNATINREQNFITLDRGIIGGVKPDFGVISNGSIVGYVTSVSDHFAIVMPILHSKFLGSVKMKKGGEFGSLRWNGGSPSHANVENVPKHAQVAIGDTVVSTGYGGHFPSDILVGFVEELDDRDEEAVHRIRIRLSTDFSKLNYVQVVSDILKAEQDSLIQAEVSQDGDNRP